MSFDLERIVFAAMERHAGTGCYVGAGIPRDKLDNAMAAFPIGVREPVYALIDSTVFGSCKRGLALTAHGLIWKNSWITDSRESRLGWAALVDARHDIRVEDTKLLIGEGCVVELIGQNSATRTARLLVDLADHLHAHFGEDAHDTGTDDETDDEGDAEMGAVIILVAVLARFARLDGVITRTQVCWLSQLFDRFANTPEVKQELVDLFNAFKDDEQSVHHYAQAFIEVAPTGIIGDAYEKLWRFATLEGQLSPACAAALSDVAQIFGLGQTVYRRRRAAFMNSQGGMDEATAHRPPPTGDAADLQAHYAVLGCPAQASDAELRFAFKRKMAAFHPDKLHGKGLAEEFIAFATEQAQRINQAYDAVIQHRRDSPS